MKALYTLKLLKHDITNIWVIFHYNFKIISWCYLLYLYYNNIPKLNNTKFHTALFWSLKGGNYNSKILIKEYE